MALYDITGTMLETWLCCYAISYQRKPDDKDADQGSGLKKLEQESAG